MSGRGPMNKGQQPPKYLNDFSKALAAEVRVLLEEVGQLRDERRRLQYEIAELMTVKSKHGAGGEYAPEWKPALPPPPEPAPPPPEEAAPPPAPPAWRSVHVRPPKKEKHKQKLIAAGPATAAAPTPPAPSVPSWAQWKPNPSWEPSPRPPLAQPTPVAAKSPSPSHPMGLFGPRTPPPQ